MSERDIFLAALEKSTENERAIYLTDACGGDATLRQRIEELLKVHDQSGDFLQKPLVERLAEAIAAKESPSEMTEPSAERAAPRLDFLIQSDKPGSLGRLGS